VVTEIHSSSGAIFDSRTQKWTVLPNNMPVALFACSVVANAEYAYVIGGANRTCSAVNTLYRLSLKTLKWTTMVSMRCPRDEFPAVLKGNYIYVFGGLGETCCQISAERYSIADNSWEDIPDLPRSRYRSAGLLGNDIYIVGGLSNVSPVIFDTVSLRWKTEDNPSDMPKSICHTAAVVLKDRYLVVIGGMDSHSGHILRSCFIYDSIFNCWSKTPVSMNMIERRQLHSAAVLDGKIVVSGNDWTDDRTSSIEFINVDALLEYAPLIYQFPPFYFNQILILVKGDESNKNWAKRKRCDDKQR